jgi:hypothetical protein
MGLKEHTKQIIVQANPAVRMVMYKLSTLEPIPAGGSIIVEAYATEGYMAYVEAAYYSMNPQAGALSGNSLFSTSTGEHATNSFTTQLFADQVYNKFLRFNGGKFSMENTGSVPDYTGVSPIDAGAQYWAQKSVFDGVNPLRITFVNNTDVDHTNEKSIRLWVREEKVG